MSNRDRIVQVGFVLALTVAAYGTIATNGFAEDRTFKGILRLATQPIVQIDPAFISSDPEVAVANSIYDYLVDIDADNNIQPRLATAWAVSDDGLTYTFTLANGVTFHDGSSLTSKDVVWTFDRLRDPALGSPTVNLYSNIESIEATSDLGVTFKLKETNPFFLFDLSDNHALIVKAGTIEATDFNGTGPFIVTNYSPEDRIEMVANSHYFVEDLPKLERLEFIFFNDQAAAIDALRSGQVDVTWRMSNALFLILQGEPGLNAIVVPTNAFDLVRLRADREPGNDPRVIRALKLATDRESIFSATQLGFGAMGRDSPIGPLYKDYFSEAVPIPPRDIEAAKALLAEAGYPDGLKLDLHTPDTGSRPDFAVILKEQWAEAGIDINVIVEPESVYYGQGNWLEVDLGITGWGSRPTPQFYLDVMLVCEAKWNESRFCDSELDELARIAGSTLDEAERERVYAEIQRIMIERGPIIIPYFFAQNAVISDRFEGFTLKAFPGRSDLRTVRLK
ncbi:MAG: ABC transporter substrate-binding protein [Candidatus Bipolaricaulia bacterium]